MPEVQSNPITEQIAFASLSIDGLTSRLANLLLVKHRFESPGSSRRIKTKSGFAYKEISDFVTKYIGSCTDGKKKLLISGIDEKILAQKNLHCKRQMGKRETDPLQLKTSLFSRNKGKHSSEYKDYFRSYVAKVSDYTAITAACGVMIKIDVPRHYDTDKKYIFTVSWIGWPKISWSVDASGITNEREAALKAKETFPVLLRSLAKKIDVWESLPGHKSSEVTNA